MIKHFKHKGLEAFFVHNDRRWLNAKDVPKIARILDRLDCMSAVKDMDIPGWGLHELKGHRKGVFSVTVQRNWRITFCVECGDAFNVNLEDYH